MTFFFTPILALLTFMNLKFPWSWTLGWKNNATRNLSSLYFSSWFMSFWLRSTLLFFRASYLQTWHGHCYKKFTRAASLNFKCSHSLKKKSEFTRPFGGKKKKRGRGKLNSWILDLVVLLRLCGQQCCEWIENSVGAFFSCIWMKMRGALIYALVCVCKWQWWCSEWEGKSTSDHLRAHWFWTREYSHVQPLFSVICYCILQKYCIWIF